MDFRTLTPLQQLKSLGESASLTEEEAVEFAQQSIDRRRTDAARDRAVHAYWWLDYGTADRRTSLITDPRDGRIPPLAPTALQAVVRPRMRPITQRLVLESGADGPEDRGVGACCILGFSFGPPIVPSGYNNILQVMQTPGHVVIFTEMVHEARIVPLDNRPHLPCTVFSASGSVIHVVSGRATLATETTGFSGTLMAKGVSGDTYRVVEHLSRLDLHTLEYGFTVEDPTWWTRPWTATIPMTLTSQAVYEMHAMKVTAACSTCYPDHEPTRSRAGAVDK